MPGKNSSVRRKLPTLACLSGKKVGELRSKSALQSDFGTTCNYRIYSLNRPDRLLIKFLDLIKFSPFLASVVCLLCNKIINGNNKTRRCSTASFCNWNTLKKSPSSRKSLISAFSISISISLSLKSISEFRWEGEGGMATYSRLGAYSRWALIRGWALIRINTVIKVFFARWGVKFDRCVKFSVRCF